MSKPIVDPESSVVAPEKEVQLHLRPEKGRYRFALSKNESGGSVDEQGRYRAGPKPGTDVISVSGDGGTSEVTIRVDASARASFADPVRLAAAASLPPRPQVSVMMQPAALEESPDKVLWLLIRARTEAIGFPRYKAFIDGVMCGKDGVLGNKPHELSYHGLDAYEWLKKATEYFLMAECGLGYRPELVRSEDAARMGWTDADLDPKRVEERRDAYYEQLLPGEGKALPFMARVRKSLSDLPLKGPGEAPPNCYGILRSEVTAPCLIELIWSYWHEEAMLVQTLNAVSMRFQNRRSTGRADALRRFDLSPLRPVTNLLWGYIQDEQHRLTVPRRAYEYDHHYGLTLLGKAVPPMESADSRSRFLEAFHNLLHVCSQFYKQADNTFVVADGFPVLNALKEVHLLLAEGMHNQYGDLPWTARVEMLIQMWLLARPEMQEFLGGRAMVPYREEWMGRVDTMRSMQGWGETSVTQFNDLARFGEQLLLSIRFGNWSAVFDRGPASNWAVAWRDAIQGYLHAYRAVTGVDLTATVNARRVDATLPAIHLRNRLASGVR